MEIGNDRMDDNDIVMNDSHINPDESRLKYGK